MSSASEVRWWPSRAGIVNVWRYYDEVFTFHEGRLLLRGPNGTGKSKVLELLMPFLLDASLKANRLSTFGGSERSMHWNLMGEGATGVTRVGFVWMEFARGNQWFTIGCRLSASARSTQVTPDFFTFHGRVGVDVALVTDGDAPVSRSVLEQRLAGVGNVHASGAEYKQAVRQVLFPGLSQQRYEALVTALLQLRTPKLSERLDPAVLSHLLSRALPPLDRGEIAELADGFERLDRQRTELGEMGLRVDAASGLAAAQRRYARRVLRFRAAGVISATTSLDNLTRRLRELDEARQAAEAKRDASQEQLEGAKRAEGELGSRIEVLKASEEFAAGREIHLARGRAAAVRRRAGEVRGKANGEDAAARGAEAKARDAQAAGARDTAAARTARDAALEAARSVGLSPVMEQAAVCVEAGDVAGGSQLVTGAVRARQQVVGGVQQVVRDAEKAVGRRQDAEADLDGARTDLATADTAAGTAAGALAVAVREQAAVLRSWALARQEIRFAAADVDALEDAADDEALVQRIVRVAADEVLAGLAGQRAEAKQVLQTLTGRHGEAEARLRDLEARRDVPPPAPYTRIGERDGRAGAALWRLVAFRDGVPAPVQAAVEAGLEASGLLDAWVGVDGLLVDGHDTFAVPGAPVVDRSLAEVLVVEPDTPVPAAHVERLLASIGYGESLPDKAVAAVGADGRWRLATATGSWSKPAAQHIGATARERNRQQQISEARALLEQLDVEVTACRELLGALQRRQELLDAERVYPPFGGVNAARRAFEVAQAAQGSAGDRVRAAELLVAERAQVAVAAVRARDAAAAEHALPVDEEALGRVAAALETLRDITGRWFLDAQTAAASAAGAVTAAGYAAQARAAADARAQEAVAAETEAGIEEAALEEMEATVGASYEDVLARIDTLTEEKRLAGLRQSDLNRALIDLERTLGELSSGHATATEQRDGLQSARDTAAGQLRRCAMLGFFEDAGAPEHAPAADAGVTAVLECARIVAGLWTQLGFEARHLAEETKELLEAVHDAGQKLGGRADVTRGTDEDLHIVSARIDGVTVTAARLFALLVGERDASLGDITAAEGELFDRILTGNTRRHLASRIRQANELVAVMNSHLGRVRTSSGLAVRLLWQVDAGQAHGTQAARELLLKNPAQLTDKDNEALHVFFRERVAEAQERQTAGSWEEQLAEVLDYTRWHQFVVKLDKSDGDGWQLLTRKRHGALSGGEKAIALHLPLFAAVAAHYHTVAEAPRLILLDEVFAGVDTKNRGQIFELLTSLDLDLMLTSDHEWCTYRELPGIAIHLLMKDDADAAVTSVRWEWDGAVLTAADAPRIEAAA